MQLPLAIFGLALATVSLPLMSKAVAHKNIDDMKETLNLSVRFSVILLIPAAAGLIVLGLPIIKVLFQRGKFDDIASILTNQALICYAIGLPAYAISKIFANTFFSFQDTKTPVKVAFFVMIIHVILCLYSMTIIGVGGLALATSICAYINFIILAYKIRKKIGNLGIIKIIKSLSKAVVASVVMGIICYFIMLINASYFILLPISIVFGIFIFILTAKLLKSEEIEQLLKAFFNKISRSKI
jgi:putative peptidoglycan lipid II flippase